jgi:glycosyltransferase involved in cell wall biosynthesis
MVNLRAAWTLRDGYRRCFGALEQCRSCGVKRFSKSPETAASLQDLASGEQQEFRDVPPRSKPLIVYLVTEDWYFLSHRLPMARAARDAGYEVHVATHLNGEGGKIVTEGFRLHELDWQRGSFNPFNLVSIVRQVRALYRCLQPDLVHHVALQPSVVGSLAALGMPFPQLNALAGLGFGFTSVTIKGQVARSVLSALLRCLFRRPQAAVLVQNPDDYAAMASFDIAPERIFTVPGSGVDTERLKPLPEPAGPVTVGFVGRLLDDKGIRTLVEAHDLLTERGENIPILIAGDRDAANPTSIDECEIESWKTRPGIEVLGFVEDIPKFWARAHIAVLPSRREGLPKSLLEAAACGRAIVATDVPGCREIARPGVNALLVPADNAVALADAVAVLARDPQLRQSFATAGRQIVENEFASALIGRQILAVYDHLVGCKPRLLPQASARG